ncbi:hypothetical protein COB28_04885 [Candidatus Dependentiae bacterium]|nr:MAG: hypothetical protein COB28_04885 [Candidatus Dependentiae bacterium]
MIKKIIYLSLFFYINIISALSIKEFENPKLWHDKSIAEYLKTASVKNIIPMREFLESAGKKDDFTNEVSLIELEGGIRAVFKPGEDNYFEEVAYNVSCHLEYPYVPPTVMRTINNQEGSLQLFVETEIDLLDDGMYEQMFEKFDENDINNLKLFYFVFGQWDSGAYNLLAYEYEKKVYAIAIDNEGFANMQKVRYGELPYIRICYDESFKTNDFDIPFPFDSYKILKKSSKDDMNQDFVKKLPDWFRTAPYNHRKYILYQDGFWCQFHAFNDKFIKSYVDICSEKIYQTLQKLDRSTLHSLYKKVLNNGLFKEAQIDDILERRDQVLASVKAS